MDASTLLVTGTFAATAIYLFGPPDKSRSWAQGAIIASVFAVAAGEIVRWRRVACGTVLAGKVKDQLTEDLWTAAQYHGARILESLARAVERMANVESSWDEDQSEHKNKDTVPTIDA